jgi:hypothetical protein
VGRG